MLDGTCTVNDYYRQSNYYPDGCAMSPNFSDDCWPDCSSARYVDTDSVTCTFRVNRDVDLSWLSWFDLGFADYLEITRPGDLYPQRYYGGFFPYIGDLQVDTTISFVTNSSDFSAGRGFKLCGYKPTGAACLHFPS